VHDVRCRGDRQKLGVSNAHHDGVYCAPTCAKDFAASENEYRDSVLELLDARGVDRQTLAAHCGITKQRVHQIVTGRRDAVLMKLRGML